MADPMKPETTPEKMIADIVANRIHGEPESYAKAILSALSSAGFVIVPWSGEFTDAQWQAFWTTLCARWPFMRNKAKEWDSEGPPEPFEAAVTAMLSASEASDAG